MNSVKIQQFEGPLDLLLSLIEEQKLDITQISLAQVTEQFLQYVRQLEQIDPTLLADYLTIAAKLLVIKSKAILPTLELEPEEEDAGADLESRLLLYKQFKEAARFFKKLDNRRRQGFLRTLTFEQRISFFPDPSVLPQSLHKSVLAVLNSLKELDNLPKARLREAVSIQEKIDHLKNKLGGQVETKLSELLASAKNKTEVVVTFLALLELVKQRFYVAEQESLFTEVVIRQYRPSQEAGNGGQEGPRPEIPEEAGL